MTVAIKELQSIIAQCVLSFWYFYSGFCYSKDVNDRKTPHKKAPQWRYLKKFLDIIEKYRRIVILKGRQMFFSTFAMIYVLWCLLFSTRALRIFIISESLEKAYTKYSDASLTGRLLYAYNHLPDFMKTTIDTATFPRVVLFNKITQVSITISPTKPSAGRGDSYDLVIVDEYAWHEASVAKDLISGLAPMAYRLWVISSARGRNHFWKLIQDVIKGEMEGFYFWDATKEKIDEEDTERIAIYDALIKATPAHLRAREFAGSFDETQEGKTFPDFNFVAACLDKPLDKEDIFNNPRIGGMDYGMNPDKTALLLYIIKGGEFHKFLSLELNNCLPEAFVGACVNRLMTDYQMTEIEARMILAETEIFGDASADNVSFTHDTTLLRQYRAYGLNNLKPSIRLSIRDGILAIHEMISQNRLREFYNQAEADKAVITHIQNCHFPISNAGILITLDRYDHDSPAFSSHILDCVRYMCLNYLRRGKSQLEGSKIDARRNAIAERVNPVFLGQIKDFHGNVIRGGDGDNTNLT